MTEKKLNQPNRFQVFFFIQFCFVMLLQLSLMSRLIRVSRVKIELFDYPPYIAHWLLVVIVISLSASVICVLIEKAKWKRTSTFLAIFISTLMILLPISDAISYLTFGVHLTHPTILSAFSLKGLNFGVQISFFNLFALILILSILIFGQSFLLKLSSGEASRFFRFLTWRQILPRALFISVSTVAVAFGYTEYFGPRAFPHASIWGFDELFIDQTTLGNRPIPKYAVENVENFRLDTKPDILTIFIESLRWDMITQEIAPNIYALSRSEHCSVSERHFAGSNLTAKGAFSWIYGMEAYRYQSFGETKIPSLPLTILRNNGYRILGFDASGMLSYPIPPLDVDQFDSYEIFIEGRAAVTDEKKIVKEIKETHSTRDKNTPVYSFVFLYATHDPYIYPKDFPEHFSPTLEPNDEFFSVNISKSEVHRRILNRYMNSVRYVDSIVGEILSIYADDIANGKLIVAVSGDHGEEFWEFGSRGHIGGRFQDVRIRVPLTLCFAGKGGKKWPLSTHADVFPTILSWMSADQLGKSAFQLMGGEPLDEANVSKKFVVVSDASFPVETPDFTLITPDKKYLFNLNGRNPDESVLVGVLKDDAALVISENEKVIAADLIKDFKSSWFRFFKTE